MTAEQSHWQALPQRSALVAHTTREHHLANR